jgi:transcriptional regulator with XRE-family HTH domain
MHDKSSALTAKPHEIARDISSLVHNRIARAKQSAIADALGMSRSAINHIVTGETGIRLEILGAFLESLSLRVVDKDDVTIPEKELEALRMFAERGIRVSA